MFSYCAYHSTTSSLHSVAKMTDRTYLLDALSGAFVLSLMNYFLLGWNLPVCRRFHFGYMSRQT